MEMQRPFFFQGKVLTSDGGPPPESAVIELVCGGSIRPQAHTNSKGQFSFTLGDNNASMMADASYGAGMDMPSSRGGMNPASPNMSGLGGRGYTERDLMGCELRANLPGYRSDVVSLSGRRFMDNPDIGVILLRRLAGVEGFTFSMTTANAPKDAKKAYEKGMDLAKKNKLAEAEQSFQKAVAAYPKYAIAWSELGRVQAALKKPEEAKQSLQSSIDADAKLVTPYLHLSSIHMQGQKWQELADSTARLTKLDPYTYPQMWLFNAIANINLQKLDDAEKSAREALKLDPDHRMPKASHVLGVILANKRDYPAALEHMRGYLNFAPLATDVEVVKKQVAELERIVGQAPAAEARPNPRPPQQ
jgi:tetratricopeptide (TPR) repeat protein